MKITIVYDNEAWGPGLRADWGFACLVESGNGGRVLFDTGARGAILLENMQRLGIDPRTISKIFISHAHWDHTGGLAALPDRNPEASVYLPAPCSPPARGMHIISIHDPRRLTPHLMSTGVLTGGEQSLVLNTGLGLAVICGCAHPGVEAILEAAARFGRVTALIGGLHGFREFDLLRDLSLVCPCHCTQYTAEIKARYPQTFVSGGAGKVLEL